jgi:hypothetical protein
MASCFFQIRVAFIKPFCLIQQNAKRRSDIGMLKYHMFMWLLSSLI